MPKDLSRTPRLARSDLEPIEAVRLQHDGLDALLGFQVRLAHAALIRDFNAAFQKLDLTQKQCATLWLLGANPGVSQATLAATLRMDRATMMAIIDRLEEGKLVLRKRSTTDRRRQELHLTLAGQRLLVRVKAIVARQEQTFTARLTPVELATLLAALGKIWNPA